MRSILPCIFLLLAALPTAAEEVWPADELSRTAITRNQQTLARLGPCALEMTSKRSPTDPTPTTAILKYRGTLTYADWVHGGLQGPLAGRTRTVINDAYVVTIGDDSPVAYQYECDGSARSTQAAMTHAPLPTNPLKFAFGNGIQTLEQAMEPYRHQGFACAAEEVTDDSGRRVVRMVVYSSKNSGPSDARWAYDFDPARGYAITRRASMSGTTPSVNYQVELQPAEIPGTWLPRHIWRRTYAHGDPTGNGSEEFDVKLVHGADLSDGAFRITALNLQPNQMVVRTPADGRLGSYLYLIDGVLVSNPFAGRPDPSQRTGNKVAAVGSGWPAICAAVVFVAGLILVTWTGSSSRRARHNWERK